MGGGNTSKPIIGPEQADALQDVLAPYFTSGPTATPGGPRVLLTGVDAVKAAQSILLQARPYTYPGTVFGDVLLVPGKVWSGQRVLLEAGPMTVHYMVGNNLYEWRTSDFIRTEWLNAMATGADTARWQVKIAKVAFQFTLGLLVPWYGMLLISVATMMMLYESNEQDVETLREHKGIFWDTLMEFSKKFPVTFAIILRLFFTSIKDNILKGITAEDIAFWLGRLVRGYRAMADVTLLGVVRLISFTTFVVGVLHLPSIVSGALGPAAEDFALKLMAIARQQNQALSKEEALAVLAELSKEPKEAARLLEKLGKELLIIQQAAERISKWLEHHAV